ncbi:hypothetical protein CsSME_00014593 [Camellia sinensis var. sinensis]
MALTRGKQYRGICLYGPHPGEMILWLMIIWPLPGENNTVVTRRVTRLRVDGLEFFFCQPATVPPEDVPFFTVRPLVIPGLLAGYDTKPIGVGLGRDTTIL